MAAEYPAHVAAEWLGHSRLVAQQHYWQITEQDFERATQTEGGAQGGAEGGAQVAQTVAPTAPASEPTRCDK